MKNVLKKLLTGAGVLCFSMIAALGIFHADVWAATYQVGDIIQAGEQITDVCYIVCVKPGQSAALAEKLDEVSIWSVTSDMLQPYLLHGRSQDWSGDPEYGHDGKYNPTPYRAISAESGAEGWIIKACGTAEEGRLNYILLEPYYEEPADTPYTEPPYTEPAWLTDCKAVYAETDRKLAEALPGDGVELDFGVYYNLSNARMRQIAERNDVNFILSITYDNVTYKLFVPAGTEIDLSCEWYGPLKLLSMFSHEIAEV